MIRIDTLGSQPVEIRPLKAQMACCSKVPLYLPAVRALKNAGMIPIPQKIAERAEASLGDVGFFFFSESTEKLPNSSSQAQEYGANLRRGIELLKSGDRRCSILYEGDFSIVEQLLFRILRPDDFTVEQQVAIFDAISTRVYEVAEGNFYHSQLGYGPPVTVMCESVEPEKDGMSWCERVENSIARVVTEQRNLRDMGGYDWTPLEHFFGGNLATLIQSKTASLNAELECSHKALMREYHDFLDIVSRTSKLGSMRDNTLSLESSLLGKFTIHLVVKDIGKGAKMTKAANERIGGVVKTAKVLGGGLCEGLAGFFQGLIKG